MSSFRNDDVPQLPQSGLVLLGPGGKRAKTEYRLPKLSTAQERAVSKAKKYAMEQNIKSVLVQQTLMQQQQLQKQQQATMMNRSLEQIWTKLGTIYVGSINFDVREDTVKTAFSPFGPMKSISLGYDHLANKHKGYAFIEYEIPEAAFLAMEQMNNVMLGGRNIKVGRPSNMPQCQPVIERLMVEASKYNRIYVTSIHPDLTESDVRTVFEAFGKIVSMQMFPDIFRPGKHKGYAFIEYDSPQSVADAVTNMNLFDLGGQYLRVSKAVTPPNMPQLMQPAATPMPTAAAVAAAAVTAKINAMDIELQAQGLPVPIVSPVIPLCICVQAQGLPVPTLSPVIPIPGVVIPKLAGLPQPSTLAAQGWWNPTQYHQRNEQSMVDNFNRPTTDVSVPVTFQKPRRQSRVMVLKNMVGPEDLDEELESEVTDECAKYGEVDKVVIYQEKQSEEDDAEVHVKIFVQFALSSETDKAIQSLNNRFFGGRRVEARVYDELLFERGELSA